MKLAVFVGTRPEIIKLQPVIRAIKKRHHKLVLVQTGQHFDFVMSGIFLRDLDIGRPDYSLGAKSLLQGAQTASILKKSEVILRQEKPDIVLIEGDTNSALGAALAASKLDVPIGHVEAGCRSFDKTMPEEINRILISDIASLHFCPTKNCKENLLRESILSSEIFLTGHPLVDLLKNIANRLSEKNRPKLPTGGATYALVTMHRRENIVDKTRLGGILSALDQLSNKISIIFPCHPHTKLQINKLGLYSQLSNLHVIDPVGYIDSLSLIKNAKYVLTDSGGVQQEAAILNTPCITLREITEWIETVNLGINFLAGYQAKRILQTVKHVERNLEKIKWAFGHSKTIFGEAGASDRILKIIEHKIT